MQLDALLKLAPEPWPSWAGPQELTGQPGALRPCLEHSEKPEALRLLLDDLSVGAEFLGLMPYFDDDGERRPVFRVKLRRVSSGAEYVFTYGASIHDREQCWAGQLVRSGLTRAAELTAARREFAAGLLYSILECCGLDYSIPCDFDEFCGEFGYDPDSRRALALFERCQKAAAGLRRVFTEDDVEALPR
jgi:hypothetical protein